MEINTETYLKQKSFSKVSSSERAELLRSFVGKVSNRKGNLTPKVLAIKLSHVVTGELHYLYQQCEQARNFSAMFWWLIKVKK